MTFPYDDDELVRLAYVIPDLQVSDLQKDGPFYLPKETDSLRPRYIQSQTKFKSFYKLKAGVRYFLTVHRRFERINKGRVFETWKRRTLVEELERKDFVFSEKLCVACRVFGLYWAKRVRKAVGLWKLESIKWRIGKKVVGQVSELERERMRVSREGEGIRKEIRTVEEKLRNLSQARNDLGVSRGSSLEGLLKLRRENAVLVHKLDSAGKVFSGYLEQIQGFLHSS